MIALLLPLMVSFLVLIHHHSHYELMLIVAVVSVLLFQIGVRI